MMILMMMVMMIVTIDKLPLLVGKQNSFSQSVRITTPLG